ncbi:MAG: hypothetical protein J1D88_00020 [Treponema sp.]|nr:hypothetical protein [Treponema sp.]
MAGTNIFHRLFSSLFSSNDPDAAKKRMLKSIAKELQKSKFHYYKYASHEVQPSMAKFFYDVYKAVAPAQKLFENTNPALLKNAVINASLSEKQLQLENAITEAAISEQAKTVPIKELRKKVEKDTAAFVAEFDGARVTHIDSLYNKLIQFRNFVSYDFYFLLKKFDSSFRERNFDIQPHFVPITGTYIAEDLKNFISVAWAMPLDTTWDDMFKLVKSIKGTEPLPLNVWKKLLVRLRSLRDHSIFEMMIKLITENPQYSEKIKADNVNIVDDYIASVRKQSEETVAKIQEHQTSSKVDGLLGQIFGNTPVRELKNYNESNSSAFVNKNIGSYIYSAPLSYLKQFLLDFTKKEMRELSDILLVRGEWSNTALSKPMSEAYHQLLEISDRITTFDDRLAETAEVGIKIKTFMPQAERNKEARNIIHTLLRDANAQAGAFLSSATQNYVIYAKNLKLILEDFVKVPNNELIMNWRHLDSYAEGNLKNMCIDAYKKIFSFVSLLQNFPVDSHEDSDD